MKHRILLVIFLFSQVMWAQDNSKEIWQPDEKDFFGIWEAVLEGTPPDTAKKEEPSKLIIFKDNANRTVVFLAVRNADRQIKFIYGVATFKDGKLYFNEQGGVLEGFPYVIRFGGRFSSVISVWPDHPYAEASFGDFIKVTLK